MLKLALAAVSSVLLGTSVLAQARWDQIALAPEGMEYRLRNEDGNTLILVCQADGIVTGFEFAEAHDYPSQASVRAIPGQRQNVALRAVSDRLVRVTGLAGTTVMLTMLHNAPRMFVRVPGMSTYFRTQGSAHIVNGCFERQEVLPGGPNPVGTAPLPSPCIRSQIGNPCQPEPDGAAINAR